MIVEIFTLPFILCIKNLCLWITHITCICVCYVDICSDWQLFTNNWFWINVTLLFKRKKINKIKCCNVLFLIILQLNQLMDFSIKRGSNLWEYLYSHLHTKPRKVHFYQVLCYLWSLRQNFYNWTQHLLFSFQKKNKISQLEFVYFFCFQFTQSSNLLLHSVQIKLTLCLLMNIYRSRLL